MGPDPLGDIVSNHNKVTILGREVRYVLEDPHRYGLFVDGQFAGLVSRSGGGWWGPQQQGPFASRVAAVRAYLREVSRG